MNYNIYCKGHFLTCNLLDLTEEKLNKILLAYFNGDSSVTISGKRHPFSKVSEIAIFTNESGLNAIDLENHLKSVNLLTNGFGSSFITPSILSKFGNDVTEDRIGDREYGCKRVVEVSIAKANNYISVNRIAEIKSISVDAFDLNKLIRLCEELNSNWFNENYYTVGLLLRTIINHIPPIFGNFQTFDQVVAGYGGSSFKKNTKSLNDSLRSIADSYTHQTIRKKEPLPNSNQVDFRQNLDFLLSEIISYLH